MKKITLSLCLFGICCNLAYSQSPITNFTATISERNCGDVQTSFSIIGNSADKDSLCWNFGDGTVRCGNFNRTSYVYTQPGTYTVTLTVWLNGIKTQIVKPDLVTVYNAPTALFDYNVSNSNMFAPLQVNFNNQSVLGDGDIVEYSWFIGNYMPLSNNTDFSYTFERPGTYWVRLTLNDNLGCEAEHLKFIVVKDSIQINEFEYITSSCDGEEEPPCPEGINYTIENNTLKLFGQVIRNCCPVYNTAIIIDKGDTIQIPTFGSGLCTCVCPFCFEINIPDFNRDSCVLIFDNQIININSISNIIEETQNNTLINVINVPNGVMFDIKNNLGKTSNLSVFNMAGIMLYSYKVGGNQQITINLGKGFYFYQIYNKTDKFIVK